MGGRELMHTLQTDHRATGDVDPVMARAPQRSFLTPQQASLAGLVSSHNSPGHLDVVWEDMTGTQSDQSHSNI